MPRPRAARTGVSRLRREAMPRAYLGPAALARGEGGRPRRAPAGPSPVSTSGSPGAGRQRRQHSRPGTRYLRRRRRRREFPGARTPRPPSLLLSPPAPPLRSAPDRGRPRARAREAGVAATCARPLTGTRALLPACSAFRRGSSARGRRAAARLSRAVLAGPTWRRRGPGGLRRGRGEKAAPACGSLPARARTPATGEAGLRLALRDTAGCGALFGDGGWGSLERRSLFLSQRCVPAPFVTDSKISVQPGEPPGRC